MAIRNYKMIVRYDGTRYFGWEHQPDKETVQGKLETVLSRLAEEEVEVIGAGRTDAGVHAEGMCCHFRTDTDLSPEELRELMNRYLPEDIAVVKLTEASDRFHARYNATGKTYRYTIYNGTAKPVFDRKYAWHIDGKLHLEKMKEAAEILRGKHDYAAFCKTAGKNKSTVRNVDRIDIRQKGEYLILEFHGDGFLRNMVRILTGTLVAVGKGQLDAEQVRALMEEGDRRKAPPTAPAQGLCLVKVDYD
ncbi:MAG: tRNA pseudouridine(38-40) synthase TruA [Lachnospiraceae bacterium]|nr:tRNA pseudouridine(38-40) synthase TruA [Lachnospiraceae bacterium]